MYIKLILYCIFTYVVYVVAKSFPLEYKYDDYKDFVNILISISGMIFTIMGIWIAFLYPNALSRLANPEKIAAVDFSETLEDTRRLENIVAAVLKSALVMMVVLGVFIAKVILFKTDLYSSNIIIFKSLAFAILLTITMVQVEAVLSVVLANVRFINELHRKRQDRQSETDY